MVNNQNKIAYLQLIQEPIGRMSTISSIIKGFCITVMSGLLCVFFDKNNYYILLFSIGPILIFMVLDIYYLGLERRFRYLYNLVAEDKKEIDYSLKFIGSDKECKSGKWDCFSSFSIWFFYSMPILLIGIIFCLSVKGII